MKKWLFLMTGIVLFASVLAQAQGVNFEKGTLQEALDKAKASERLVFVDCYTEWCGPCKGMDKQVFPREHVGQFMNEHFVSVKMDMEKGEGPALLKKYAVGAFPSFLLLKPDGSLHFKFVGGMSDTMFIATLRRGMESDNRVFMLEQAYASGNRKPEISREYIKMKVEVQEIAAAQEAAKDYLAQLTPEERTLPENWFLFGENRYAMYLSDVHSVSFRYLVKNRAAFVKKNTADTVDARIRALYGKLAEHALQGWYFKKESYVPGMFSDLLAYAEAADMEDRKQMVALVKIADAAGRNDHEELMELLAENTRKFSEQNRRVFFSFFGGYYYRLPKGDYAGTIRRICSDIIAASSNQFLVSQAETRLKMLNEKPN